MKYEIPIKLDTFPDGGCHIIVNAEFNSIYGGTLIIDTGASKTVLDCSCFKEIARFLPTEKKTNSDFDEDEDNEFSENDEEDDMLTVGITPGRLDFFYGELDLFQIHDFKIENYQSVFIDLGNVNSTYERLNKFKVWGLIGSDFLHKYKAVIDYENLLLVLTTPENA